MVTLPKFTGENLAFFSGFLEKNTILCILKGEMPFKMHKIIIIFPEKKICVPTLPKIFRPVTRNTLIFLFGLMHIVHLLGQIQYS